MGEVFGPCICGKVDFDPLASQKVDQARVKKGM